MLDFIYQAYMNYLWLPFVELVKYFESKPAGIYVLIVILIILSVIQSRMIKKNTLNTPAVPAVAARATNKKTKKKIIKTPNQKKYKILDKVLTFCCLFIVSLIVGVCYIRFSPAVIDFLKTDTPTDTTTQPANTNTTTTPTTTTTTPTPTPTQQTAPTYQTTKRLYYYCSCSGCWAEGCQQDGYSYGGYDANYYSYYYTLCKACKCNSFNATSFWK